MAEEREISRYLQHLHGSQQTSTEASFTSPLLSVIEHDVYSSNPENLPLQGDRMEQTQRKKYYCTRLKHRGPAASGTARRTPEGRWKARDGPMAIMSKEGSTAIRFLPWKAVDEINAMEGEGLTTIGFKKKFEYKKGRNPEQNTKWAMIEYTLYPPAHMGENRYALCYVYKTKQDGRQRNGIGRFYPQQPTNQYEGESSLSTSAAAAAGGGSSLSDSATAAGGSSLLQISEEFQFNSLEEMNEFLNAPF